ncbi:CPBP family intramembrane glutamic endopeptidase [Brevundimonas sp.]|uniref:CPBP family intramembrane glutamic endopeptidase n=1 Tax=Brevundimonas sp. TaxID=1871086 RepID=UPI002D64C326|nr:CPBP family intramembrane glutamic endopeptidase [Brevundimonas sp.]HYC69142.1 CPBP family intramembrane glutamic endopeptidase [Brevundimonas sp.]
MAIRTWGVPAALGEARVLHPGPLRWLRALGWMVALLFAITIPAGLAITGLDSLLPEGGPSYVISNSVGALLCLLLYGLLVWGGEARRPDELGWRALPVDLVAGLLIGLLMFAAVMGLMSVFGLYDIAWKGPASAWEAAGASIQSGVMEEVLIRGVVLRLLWRAFGPWAAFAISAVLFGAGHLGNPNASVFAALCIAVEAGIMLGAFYALTGRLWVSIGVHAAWNFTQGYLFGAAVSGTDFGPAVAVSTARPGFADYLTGGPFGPEASLPALIVGTLVGVGVLVMAWKAGRFDRRPAATDAASG